MQQPWPATHLTRGEEPLKHMKSRIKYVYKARQEYVAHCAGSPPNTARDTTSQKSTPQARPMSIERLRICKLSTRAYALR